MSVIRHDLPASLVVFLIAIPLSLGIAAASGAPLLAGLIAAVVGGIVAGAIGGARLQVSGPAAGLTVIVAGVIGAFGRHVAGVDFDSLDGSPTHLFFLLVAPEDSVGQHLKALARVSRLLKDRAFRDKLIAAPDGAAIFGLIREEDEKL